MFCKKCGKQIEDDSVYCPICGVKQSGGMVVERAPTVLQSQTASDLQELTRQADIAYLEQLRLAEYGRSRIAAKINEMDAQIERLGYYRNYQQPQKRTAYFDFDFGEKLQIICGIFSIPLLVSLLTKGFLAVLILMVITVVVTYGIMKGSQNEKQSKYNATYDKEMQTYRANLQADKNRVENELQQRESLTDSRQRLYQEYLKADALRKALYDANIIPEPLREIEHCAYYLYSYISTSREDLHSALNHLHWEQIVLLQKEVLKQNQVIQSYLESLWRSMETAIHQNNQQYDRVIAGLQSTNQNLHQLAQYEQGKQASLDNIEFYAGANFWTEFLR